MSKLKLTLYKSLPLVLILLIILFNIACGGGGSASKDVTTTSKRPIQFSFKPGDFLPLIAGSSVAIIELGGSDYALSETQMNAGLNQEVDVDFNIETSYVLIMKVNGMPYLRTTIMASDITSAAETGLLDIGGINAVTTYLTGLLETRIHGSRRAAKNLDATVTQFLNEFFGEGITSFNMLSYKSFLANPNLGTAAFHKHKNRINMMRLYFRQVRVLEGNVTDLQKAALTDLHNGMIDETNAVALISLMASPALPSFLNGTDSAARTTFLNSIAEQGEFLTGAGVLVPDQLASIFIDARQNPELVLMVIETPSSVVSGSIAGSGNVGVSITISSGNLALTSLSEADGSYSISGMPTGNYLLTPVRTGYVFDPPSISFVSTPNGTITLGSIASVVNKGAKTMIASSSNQTLTEGYYPSITLTGSANLVPKNIKTGVEIFGVKGTLKLADYSDANATEAQTLKNVIGYGAKGKIIGTLENFGDVVLRPGSSNQIRPVGYYKSLTVLGNAHLSSNNLSYGVNVFGVSGSNASVVNTAQGTATAADILSGKIGFVKGSAVTGTLPTQALSATSTAVAAGHYTQTDLVNVDPDLNTSNIKSGVTLFGLTGSANVVDTSNATALANEITSGNTAYVGGVLVSGTLTHQTVSTATNTVPAGIYPASDLSTIETDLTAANIAPTANLFGIQGGLNDTSANATTAKVLAGYKVWVNGSELTGSLANKTLSANSVMMSAGNYASGNLVAIESDLVSNNIKSGVSIFGVSGNSYVVNTQAGDALASDMLSGVTAFVNGNLVTGTITNQTLSANTSVVNAGIYNTTNLSSVETDLSANNIKSGVSVFGIAGSTTVVDTALSNVTAGEMLAGKTAYVAGSLVTGTLPTQTLSADSVNMTSGYYNSGNLQTIETGLTSANISTGVNLFGVVGTSVAVNTASANATAGQIISGYKAWVAGSELTGTLSNQTLTDATVVMNSGNYSAGNLALIDTDLSSVNIKSGVTIFGIAGNANVVDTQGATAVAADLLSGTTAWVNGAQVTGNIASLTLSANSSVVAAGAYGATNLTVIDTDLTSGNIRSGVSIFGVSGSANVVNTVAANVAALHMRAGRTAYVGGTLVTGNIVTQSLSASNNTVLAGYYASGNMLSIEPDLVAGNISTGVNIFGVVGTKGVTDTSSGNATPSHILTGYTGWVNGVEVTGTLASQTLASNSTVMSAGNYSAGNLVSIDADLTSVNIRAGKNVFGILGSSDSVDTQSANVTAGNLAYGKVAWVNGNAITGTNTFIGPSSNAYSGNQTIGGNVFQFQAQYCIVDVSGGPTASVYPVKFTNTKPDLTGAGSLEYKTNKIVLKWIPAGNFLMGNANLGLTEHQVTLTKGFFAGVFETTQQHWLNVIGNYPSGTQTTSNSTNTIPVQNVSWEDIRGASGTHDWPNVTTIGSNTFMGNLQAKTGLKFDLPTEAEWEYSCRAGTTTKYSYGNSVDGNYMWYFSNAPTTSKTVGIKLPNPWGLYDIHGNVREWCLDWYSTYSSTNQTDPDGSSSGSGRVIRGGQYGSNASNGLSAYRTSDLVTNRSPYYGFRLFLRPN